LDYALNSKFYIISTVHTECGPLTKACVSGTGGVSLKHDGTDGTVSTDIYSCLYGTAIAV